LLNNQSKSRKQVLSSKQFFEYILFHSPSQKSIEIKKFKHQFLILSKKKKISLKKIKQKKKLQFQVNYDILHSNQILTIDSFNNISNEYQACRQLIGFQYNNIILNQIEKVIFLLEFIS
jgi:hypothetical protein